MKPSTTLRSALLLACVFACEATWAQAGVPSSAAASAAERAQKETDRTMYWIRVLADRPAPVKAAPAAAPVPAAPKPAAAVAAAPVAKPAAELRERTKVAAASPAPASTMSDSVVSPAPGAARPATGIPQSPIPDVDPTALSSPGADNAAAVGASAALPRSELTPLPPEEPDPGLSQIKSVRPDFPGNVVLKVRKGNVEVRFEVEPGGTVTDAVVVQSSNTRLNNAAIEAVKQWVFKPGPRYHTAAVNLVFDIDKE